MIDATEALERLRAGNRKFVSRGGAWRASRTRRRLELVDHQSPFAVILGCSDSRVPAEIVFDQGLGDLFVIRVAGNVCGPELVGSAEYAAERLGTRLVVVLGHSDCGAVRDTIEQLRHPGEDLSPNLGAIVRKIRPAAKSVCGESGGESSRESDAEPGANSVATLVSRAVRANVRASVRELQESSATLRGLVAREGLVLVGAEYSLESGEVDFFHTVPEESTA